MSTSLRRLVGMRLRHWRAEARSLGKLFATGVDDNDDDDGDAIVGSSDDGGSVADFVIVALAVAMLSNRVKTPLTCSSTMRGLCMIAARRVSVAVTRTKLSEAKSRDCNSNGKKVLDSGSIT